MKKSIISIILAIAMVFALSAMCFADDGGIGGISLISSPGADETEPMNFDDLKKDVEYEVSGWGILTVLGFSVNDKVSYYDSWSNTHTYKSGADAEYICLDIDILNIQTKARNFLDDITVSAVYDEDYIYSGWAKQYNYNKGYKEYFLDSSESWFAIDPMYQGHYVIACTLPNAVVNGNKPLSLTFTIDGNEFTYIVRK